MRTNQSISFLLQSVLVMALLSSATGCPGPKPPPDCARQVDGCTPVDAGLDAGSTDAGLDAGSTDAGLDAGSTDAGLDAGSTDAGLDAGTGNGAPPLILKQITAYYTRKGIEFSPRDFTTSPAELITYDGGTPVILSGIVEEPGSIRFDVPPGTYLIKSSSSQYILTSSRTVDIGSRRFGRPDRGGSTVEVVKYPYPSSLELSGLEPTPSWPHETYLQFSSMDLEESGRFMLSTPLTEGQTSVIDDEGGYETDWDSIPQYDPAQGDTAWVIQTMSRDAGMPTDGGEMWPYETLVRAAHLDPFSFDGGTLTVKATLQPVPQQDVTFEWRRNEFDALRIASSLDSGDPSAGAYLAIYPALKDSQDGWINLSFAPLLSFRIPSKDEQTPLVRQFSFGNPYPSGWEPVVEVSNFYSFSITKHDASQSTRVSESFYWLEPLSSLSLGPIRPRVSLPRDFKVDGKPAIAAQRISTTTPLVTWEPPELGTATSYTLQIQNLESAGFLKTVASIHTDANTRSMQLPPELLSSGKDYILLLTAHYSPTGTPERVPFMFTVPQARATTASGILTVR